VISRFNQLGHLFIAIHAKQLVDRRAGLQGLVTKPGVTTAM
jgi:hypothetical protein